MMRKIKSKVKTGVNRFFRIFINRKKRKQLKNRDFTLISSNCNGCLILHDLGLKYNSPFVNLYICAGDYIKLLQNFQEYMSLDLRFVQNTVGVYPLAFLGDIQIHFVHYRSEQEAEEKWNERKKRIDLSNCFVLFTDRDGCNEMHLKAFDSLPFEHKIVFTKRRYDEIASSYHIRGFEKNQCVGDLFKFKGWFGKKFYDDFDYVSWFDSNRNEEL